MKKALLFIWALPSIFFCLSGYNLFKAAWIYIFEEGKIERLDGYAYLLASMLYIFCLMVSAAIALALTVYLNHKHQIKNSTQPDVQCHHKNES